MTTAIPDSVTVDLDVTTDHIHRGCPGSAAVCPIALSLLDAGCTWTLVTHREVLFTDPAGERRRAVMPGDAAAWARRFDSTPSKARPIQLQLTGKRIDK